MAQKSQRARRGPPNARPKAHSPFDNEHLTDNDGNPLDGDQSNGRDAADDWDDALRPKDIATTEVLAPYQFRNEQFAELNIALVSDYADYRVVGWNAERAFTRVFGTDYADLHLYARIEALEHNLVYRKVFAEKFAAVKMEQMYGPKLAVYELVSLVNNPFTKCSTKLAAMKELNVLYGITAIDDAGRTVKGKSLNDFYDENQPTPNTKPVVSEKRHPEPGSVESEAFLAANK